MDRILNRCATVVVLTEEAKETLVSHFEVPDTRIRVIRHGIPSVHFCYPEASNLRRDMGASVVFVSMGHIRPLKGHDIALRALSMYRQVDPDFKYVIIGTTQTRYHSLGHADYLRSLIDQLHLDENVIWIDEYLSLDRCLEYIQAADVGLVTYTNPEQFSSGILPLILGCGRPVVATTFNCAKSVARHVPGILLADMDDEVIFRKLVQITQDRDRMRSMMDASYAATRPWVWQQAAAQYQEVFEEARKSA
jgi:glycosyltransferase involved in cell wall biosynthesis